VGSLFCQLPLSEAQRPLALPVAWQRDVAGNLII